MKLIDVYTKIIEQTDKSGRNLTEIFMELPSKEDYPDYYEIVKEPIALDIIKRKIDNDAGYTAEKFKKDFHLMCANAKTYNAKGSWVYKDAVALQKAFDGLLTGGHSNNGLPTCLKVFKDIMDLEEEDIVAPFEELPDEEEYPEYYDVIKKPISLAEIKDKIDSKEYRSVYDMEKDFVLMVDNAKTFNESGSFIYSAAETLLKRFYSSAKIEANREKFEEEFTQVEHEGIVYGIGDYAYFTSETEEEKSAIGQIYRIWKNSAGEFMIQANWFLRPEQTVHPAGRKFYEKEVFKWDRFVEHVKADLQSRCLVMFIKDYVRGRPAGWETEGAQKDVYVCESRYIESGKRIEKIKNWKVSQPEALRSEDVELVKIYDIPLNLDKTVASPFLGSEAASVANTEDDPSYEDVEEQPVVVKRKRGRPRKDPSAAPPPPSAVKQSARLKQTQQQQQPPQPQAPPIQNFANQPNPALVAEYQKMQMRMYQQQQQQQTLGHSQQGQQPMMNWISAFSMQAQAARAMAPPSRPHRVTRSITAVRQNMPEIVPAATAEKFRSVDGKMSWFTSPPLFIPPATKLAHSAAYVQYRMTKQEDDCDTAESNDLVEVKRQKISPGHAMNQWVGILDKAKSQLTSDAKLLYY